MQKRPPIVVIMGHVDHGKTTLLDYIRKTNIAAKEAGGISQAVGAYEIEHPSTSSGQAEKITFIDTPGHEAFSKMRARGGQAADIAILIIAADEGVKKQTKEAHQIIKESKIPFIIAFNKIDKPNADVNRVKNDLYQEEIFLEGAGGNISWKEISAKTGQGVNELLDLILLAAELEELQYDPETPAKGFILESKMDSRRGVAASVIVQNGTLKVGDEITVGATKAKIRSLEDFLGKRIDQAQPSAPVLILGFSDVPEVGTEFTVGGEVVEKEAQSAQIDRAMSVPDDKKTINLILNASDSGSLEALADVINNLPLPEEYKFNIVSQSVGDITDGDVKFAISTEAIIIGFKVKANKAADNLAKDRDVKVMTSEIVYELIKELEEWLNKFKIETIIGDLEILAVFGKKPGNKQVIGGKVVEGEIRNQAICQIIRNDKELGSGRIINLQQNKKDVSKVEAGNECGLLVQFEDDIRPGDHLVIK